MLQRAAAAVLGLASGLLAFAAAFVDDSAQVIGDVQIGAESSIWMNVVIRGDVNYIRSGARSLSGLA